MSVPGSPFALPLASTTVRGRLAALLLSLLAAFLLVSVPASAQGVPDYLAWANSGPYLQSGTSNFQLDSFGASQPLVTAYFFYWFDATYLSQRQQGFDPFPFHPTDAATQSFLDPAWYHKQFSDMQDAGIDFVLPDYWGEPGQYDKPVPPSPDTNLFATQGLPPMVQALQQLDAEGRPFKVGLFLDTTILNDEDLTTDRGKQIFYASIRDYYSRIPPHLWAAIGGQPVVWLYDAQHVGAFDQGTFDYVDNHFAADFGGLRPYVVREDQWYTARTPTNDVIQTKGVYGWGAAPFGFGHDPRATISEVGPGFHTSQLPGPNPVDTDRQGGAYFQNELSQALAVGRQITAIETWNELGEGSGILETQELGRQYIDMARVYANQVKGPP